MRELERFRDEMTAWRAHEVGEPAEVLRLERVEVPRPGPTEVLVEVAATGVSFGDLLFTRGHYQEPTPLPYVPGNEFSGHVVETGSATTRFRVGDRVCALAARHQGGMAQFAVADELTTFEAGGLTDAEAAVVTIAYQTSWFALHRRGQLRPAETLLVHSGAGGVGSAAIQLGLAAGARVIAVAGGTEKTRICVELGAHVVVDHTNDDFVEVVNSDTAGRGADVIFDPVNADVFDRSRRCVAPEGRLVVVGFAGGRISDLHTNHVLLKNYSVVGANLSFYLSEHLAHLLHESHEQLLQLHRGGLISPLIQRIVPFDDAPAAITAVPDRSTWGRVVVAAPRN